MNLHAEKNVSFFIQEKDVYLLPTLFKDGLFKVIPTVHLQHFMSMSLHSKTDVNKSMNCLKCFDLSSFIDLHEQKIYKKIISERQKLQQPECVCDIAIVLKRINHNWKKISPSFWKKCQFSCRHKIHFFSSHFKFEIYQRTNN